MAMPNFEIVQAGAIYKIPYYKSENLSARHNEMYQISFCKGSVSDDSIFRQAGVFVDDIIGLIAAELNKAYREKQDFNIFLPGDFAYPKVCYKVKTHEIKDGEITEGAGEFIGVYYFNLNDGVLLVDLVGIVIDYLKTVNVGKLATRETSCAITKLEELAMICAKYETQQGWLINDSEKFNLLGKVIDAQNWLNKRRDETKANGVLGTYNAIKAQNNQE